MTPPAPTDDELLAYLDEMLPASRSAEVEQMLRSRTDLRQRTALLARRRDAGGHTLGEIWRRHRLSCLSRLQLGQFVLGVAEPDLEDYILFHIQVIGCRFCRANLEDLQSARKEPPEQEQRQQKFFESSAGLLGSSRS